MFLPKPLSPQQVLPNCIVYHLHPTGDKLRIDEDYVNTWGRKDTRKVDVREMAYGNFVVPYRDAEAYRRASLRFVDFGTDLYVDKELVTIRYKHFNASGEFGNRHMTNVVIWHSKVFVGNNPDAKYVIGDDSVLHKAMESLLRKLTDVPYLTERIPEIVERAKKKRLITATNSSEWSCPIWTIDPRAHSDAWEKVVI